MPDLVVLSPEDESRREILSAMHDQGLTIIEAIKASRQLFGIGLGEAKSLVTSHPSWKPIADAAQPFHDDLIQAFQDVALETKTVTPEDPDSAPPPRVAHKPEPPVEG